MGIAVWRVTIKPNIIHFLGVCRFSPKKNVCLPTQLGACSHPTGRSTVPYCCRIDVRTPWARHSVPMGPPEARRDPTDPRRTAGGTVGPRLIGASPVWAARSSYWRQPVYLYGCGEYSPLVVGSSCGCSPLYFKAVMRSSCRYAEHPNAQLVICRCSAYWQGPIS